MSLNQASQHELLTSNYCNSASSLLAKIEGLHHASSHYEKLTHSVQVSAQKYRKIKLQLIKANNQLDSKCIWLNCQSKLNWQILSENTDKREPSQPQEQKIQIDPNAIEIASMDWAIKYLEEITIENFDETKQKIQQEQNNLLVLAANMNKYGEKLNIIEEKLKKSYEEARSKKRYL